MLPARGLPGDRGRRLKWLTSRTPVQSIVDPGDDHIDSDATAVAGTRRRA